jgi:15-cis-phytoene synthase
MRITSLALVAFLSSVAQSGAFVAPSQVRTTIQERLNLPILQSLTAPIPPGGRSNRSETEIDTEHEVTSAFPAAANGKVLEGGKIIDFESMRGPSMAENALEEAKAIVAQSTRRYGEPHTGILGINKEVISEVGHELGTFATSQDIQNCAAYLRSKAIDGLFKQRTATAVLDGETIPASQRAEFDRILRQAYLESGEVTSAFAKTFYLGTQLLPEASREAIWAIYVWCRRTDEIVDAPRDSNEEMLQDLGAWEMRLENLWDYGEVEDVYDLCLLDVLVKYPSLPITPFMDMIRGMLMDVPQLGQDRYDSFNELHLYCYRVAGTVGLMCLPVFGCAEGFTEKRAK